MSIKHGLFIAVCAAACGHGSWAQTGDAVASSVDPVTRYVHLRYAVPEAAPDEVRVRCSWTHTSAEQWRPAKVMPLLSESAQELLRPGMWAPWIDEGTLIERRAAGLERTVVFNPYPEAQVDGRVDARFRIAVETVAGDALAVYETVIQADNADVVCIEDWTGVLQSDAFEAPGDCDAPRWQWRTELGSGASLGNALYGESPPNRGLPQLSYPLSLTGAYAIFVKTAPGGGAIRLRLSGDERADRLASRGPFGETLWNWRRMDRQDLVLRQPYAYTGFVPASIDYVRFVPLPPELVASLEAPFEGERDRLVAAYWEPYSYAFHDDVRDTLWHREYLTAYADARIPLVDMQIGRFGMKVVYESRLTDRLLYATRGDPIGHVQRPETDNVGRMQQFTNTLGASLGYARELGFAMHANFGATNCYPGSPLQGDFSKAHPEWMRGSALRYEVPEVHRYIMSLYREALEIGTPGLSIDFCRYPEGVDTLETCNNFFAALRALADEFEPIRGARVPILVRFPAHGVRLSHLFDYATWAREGWVDFLCPSNIQGRHHHFDVTPYLEAVAGTACQVLPCVDALHWGPDFPGPFLWRVAQLYDAGVPGIYVYQADARVLGHPVERRAMRLLSSAEAVRRWWREDARLRPDRSKGIYISRESSVEGYDRWQRLRIWIEGIPMGRIEVLLDGELVSTMDGPPYLVGTEDYESDGVIPPGPHTLTVRARDGDGWLEESFEIVGAG